MKCQIFGAALGFLALVINPTLGCSSSSSSSSEDEYRFTEADMRAAVAGTYVGSYNGTSETVTLTLVEGTSGGSSSTQSLSLRQLQCSRSFSLVKPAAACLPMTTMTVSGRISSSNGSVAASAISGTFSIESLDLDVGSINLTLTDGSILTSNFQNGAFGAWWLRAASGGDYSVDLVKQ